MRVGVIGGRLQGVEAAYLARKAGWEVLLVDRDFDVPARGLCDTFYQVDITKEPESVKVLKGTDLLVPALENKTALAALEQVSRIMHIPLIHDAEAYALSSSKLASNRFFACLGVPAPVPWPGCGFPLIAKPSGLSGSRGVRVIRNERELAHLNTEVGTTEDWVIEESLEGPSFSIEVLGFHNHYQVLQITELEMDQGFDCKRVLAPARLPPKLKEQFKQTGMCIAAGLQLNGIMDVESILHKGKLKVLEIDARLPSQTPTVVYRSTGLNMLELIGQAFLQGEPWAEARVSAEKGKGVVYEHIQVSPGYLEIGGEHMMADCGPLHLETDFYGADEVLTNYESGKRNWVATIIVTGKNRQAAWNKRGSVLRQIEKAFDIKEFYDPNPEGGAAINLMAGVECL